MKKHPYLLFIAIYLAALAIFLYPRLSSAYEVNGIWDHPTKKGRWLVEIENKGKIIKFEIDDLSDKSSEERTKAIKWMVDKTFEKMETK